METRYIYPNGNKHSNCHIKVVDPAQLEAGRQSLSFFEWELIRVLRDRCISETDFEFMGEALEQTGAVGDVMDFLLKRMGVPEVSPELCQSWLESQHAISGRIQTEPKGNNE